MTRRVLPDPAPTEAKDSALVQEMFDRVAPRYDVMNSLLTAGTDQHWRRCAVQAAGLRPGDVVLDVATGTGRLAKEFRNAGAVVIPLDFSWNMIKSGIDHDLGDIVPMGWVNGDATQLPFRDNTVDVVTIGFGIRNLANPQATLAEFHRVVRPGGRLVVLEFSTPINPAFRTVYRTLLVHGMPQIAKTFAADPPAYQYLADSIVEWPNQPGLARWISDAGWASPQWQNLSSGVVAVHRAVATTP